MKNGVLQTMHKALDESILDSRKKIENLGFDNHSLLNFDEYRLFTFDDDVDDDGDDELASINVEVDFDGIEIASLADNGSNCVKELLSDGFIISITSSSCEDNIQFK
jgi:hypothetical protein